MLVLSFIGVCFHKYVLVLSFIGFVYSFPFVLCFGLFKVFLCFVLYLIVTWFIFVFYFGDFGFDFVL